jgi:transposase
MAGRLSTSAKDGVCTGTSDGAMARVEVITGVERRRSWSDEQKRAIVAEGFAPGAIVSEVARRADVSPGQIYRWRQEMRAAVAGFAPLLIAAPESPTSNGADSRFCEPAIDVEFAGKVRVRIPASIPADLAAAVVKALSRR